MDITLTLKCNNRCYFCPRHEYLKMISPKGLTNIMGMIKKIRNTGDTIVFSGGEVTCSDGFWHCLEYSRSLGFRKIGLISNGRKMENPFFAQKILDAGINDVAVSIYSLDPAVHDRITGRKGSCVETKKGLSNLYKLSKKRDFDLRVNTVLAKENHHDMVTTIEKLCSAGIKNFIIAEQIISDGRIPHLMPAQIKSFLLDLKRSNLITASIRLRGFPRCFYPKQMGDNFSQEMNDVDTFKGQQSKKRAYFKKIGRLFTRIQKCGGCLYLKNCEGVQKTYLSHE